MKNVKHYEVKHVEFKHEVKFYEPRFVSVEKFHGHYEPNQSLFTHHACSPEGGSC